MEQIQNNIRRAGNAKRELAQHRAMEIGAKHPQLMEFDNQPEPTEAPMRGSGGEAGLARLVGRGKSRKTSCGGTNGVMSDSDDSMSGGISGGASHQGKMLGEHLVKLHGSGFFDDFAKGFMSVVKPFAGLASMLPGTIGTVGRVASGLMGNGDAMPKRGRGRPRKMCGGNAGHASTANALGHATMGSVYGSLPGSGLGGSDVPPNGVAPMSYGNVPQAPASFRRNTVGMGKPRKALGADGHGLAPAPKMVGSGARSARGQMISRIMKERGLSLGQASKYLKEHGSA